MYILILALLYSCGIFAYLNWQPLAMIQSPAKIIQPSADLFNFTIPSKPEARQHKKQ